jgi:uncharacterized protein YndB with AHSA1/START domain
MADSIEQTVEIAAPASAIWGALTESSQLEAWYAPGCRWDIPALAPGGVVTFYNTPTDLQRAYLETIEPDRELTLSWEVLADQPHVRIRNSFLLESLDTGTKVTIRQSGYDALPAEQRDEWRTQDEKALAAIAAGLKSYVERRVSLNA